MIRYFFSALLVAVFLVGCDSAGDQSRKPEYVVESILVARQPIPPVYISTTVTLDEDYSFEESAISDAVVTVTVSGPIENEVIRYEEDAIDAGVYRTVDYYAPAQPLHTYALEVRIPGDNIPITSSTVVPDTFIIISTTNRTVTYLSEEQFEVLLSPTRSPGRTQNYYNIVTESIEPREDNLVPIAEEFYDNGDGDSLDDLRVDGSPILYSDFFDTDAAGNISITYPWIGVNFYGRNVLHFNALDDNFYDFERSRAIQEGGSGFAPGEIPNPLPHVVGGEGLFGSVARVSIPINVLPE